MTIDTFPARKAATGSFRFGAPRSFTIAADGEHVLFLRSEGGRDSVNLLWALSTKDGTERLLVDPRTLVNSGADLPEEEKRRRERLRETTSGITSYDADAETRQAVFVISGILFLIDIGTAEIRELVTPGAVIDPRINPAGTHVSYVVDGSVYVTNLMTNVHHRVSPDDSRVWGLADFAAAEELDRHRGHWWAGDRMLIERYDESDVQTWYISDPAHPDVAPRTHRYPAAGTENASVTLFVADLHGSLAEVHWNHAELPYLATVAATNYGPPVISVLSRDQKRQVVLSIDLETGLTSTLAEHVDPQWIDVVPGVPTLAPDGSLIEVVADRDLDAYRLVRAGLFATPPDIQVAAVGDVTDLDALINAWTTASTPSAVIASRTGECTPIGSGASSALRRSGIVVTSESSWSATASRVSVSQETSTGLSHIADIQSLAEDPGLEVDPIHVDVPDSNIRVVTLWPSDHQVGKGRLPIIMAPYGGPHHARVTAAGQQFLTEQWLANLGFCVIIADGRGTPGCGPRWDRAIHHNLATPVLDDQIRALDAVIAEYPDDVDNNRVGITGWSFGGYLAALAVLRRPDRFHCAVAGAPVTDWLLYDTAYTERYLGNPNEDMRPYDATSLIPLAQGLERPLMLIHGLADDNVVAAHTLQLSHALLAAGRPHTVLPLTGVTHMTPQVVIAENLLKLQRDFLVENLLGG